MRAARQNSRLSARRQAAGRPVRARWWPSCRPSCRRDADDVVHAAGRRPRRWPTTRGLNTTDITHQVGPVPGRRRRPRSCATARASSRSACTRRSGPAPTRPDPTLVGHYHSEDASGGTWHGLAHDFVERELAPDAEGHQRLDRQRGVRQAARRSWTCPRRAAAPTSTTRWSTGATSSASTTSPTACRACWPAARAASSSRAATSTTSTGTARAYFAQEDGNVIKGIPHNQFLVTALQAMGLAPADYETRREARLRLDQRQRPRPRHLGRSTTTCRRSAQILPGIKG